MNPLVTDLSNLKEQDIHAKISDLSKKYFMTRNPELQRQIAGVLDDLREELRTRNFRQMQEQMKNGKTNLDNLIKVN